MDILQKCCSPSYIGIKNVETARTDNEEAGKTNV
jgi:hypothetical protein